MVSARGTAMFIRFAILFLIACILLLFTAAAIANRAFNSSGNDDDAWLLGPSHQVMRM